MSDDQDQRLRIVDICLLVLIIAFIVWFATAAKPEPHDDPYDNPPEWCARHYSENATEWTIQWCEKYGGDAHASP